LPSPAEQGKEGKTKRKGYHSERQRISQQQGEKIEIAAKKACTLLMERVIREERVMPIGEKERKKGRGGR